MIVVPTIGISTWYAVSFLPHLSELKSINKQGKEIISNAPISLYTLVVASEGVHASSL